MNYLKSGLFFFAAFTLISLTSCKKDCTAPAISENIIGTWDTVLSGGEVEFKADGTYVDDDDSLFGVEVNGVVYDQRTYTISGTTLTLTVAAPNGGGESSTEFEVTQNECDEMKLQASFFGIEFTETLKRK